MIPCRRSHPWYETVALLLSPTVWRQIAQTRPLELLETRQSPGGVPLSKGLCFYSGRTVPTCTNVTGSKLNNGLWNDLRSSESRCSSSSRNHLGFMKVPGCLLWEESDSLSSVVKCVRQFVPVLLVVKGGRACTNCGSPSSKSPKYSFLLLLPEASPVLTFYSQYSHFCEWFLTFPAVGRLTKNCIPQERNRFCWCEPRSAQCRVQTFPGWSLRLGWEGCWKSTLFAYNLHNVHRIYRVILTIWEPRQIYRPIADMAAGFGSCYNLCNSATARDRGGFFLQGIVLCTGDFLQECRSPASRESAPSRHFIWLFLAMSVEISSFPVQLFS